MLLATLRPGGAHQYTLPASQSMFISPPGYTYWHTGYQTASSWYIFNSDYSVKCQILHGTSAFHSGLLTLLRESFSTNHGWFVLSGFLSNASKHVVTVDVYFPYPNCKMYPPWVLIDLFKAPFYHLSPRLWADKVLAGSDCITSTWRGVSDDLSKIKISTYINRWNAK